MTRQVNFGLWYDFRNPAPWNIPFETLYAQCLDQIVEAERIGFDSVWITEHHFCEDGYTPSPLVLAGAIGARTRRLRMGTNLMILPLHNPVRIAEDSATLSLLTGGRFDLGVGIGYREMEFREFGRELKHRPSLVEEAMTIIRRAWAGEPINFEGKRFKVGDLRVLPAPEHLPKLYLGGMAEPAIDRAARIADGFLSTGGIGHDTYVECLKRNGRDPADGVIIAGNWAIISDDPQREAEIVGPHVLYQSNQYIEWGAFGPPDAVPRFPDAATALAQGLYELWDADTAVERLTAMLQAYPQVRDVHFWAQFPGEPVASGQRRIEYIASKVLPRLRDALK
ncbi:MAG: LLM class flavin-dependent oxidoreductase [Steroidobacteraceae bacterium]|jgi:alkanesulfonate monooxygenase SsuD/methylene tetrahydromethanopterin reductase-like flavin-dependent oxidoreductase (luciferase family)